MRNVVAALALLALTPLSVGTALGQDIELSAGPEDGFASFTTDEFGGGVSSWDPVGSNFGSEVSGYNTFAVISSGGQGYGLNGAGTHFNAAGDDPSLTVISDSGAINGGDTRITTFDLPRMGDFTVTLTQVATATQHTMTYEITNNEAAARTLTFAYTTDLDIHFGFAWNENVGFQPASVPNEAGVTTLDGTIGGKARLFGGDFEGWRIWQARRQGLSEAKALSNELVVPPTELNVFVRTQEFFEGLAYGRFGRFRDGSGWLQNGAPNQYVYGYGTETLTGDADGDRFTDNHYPPFNCVIGSSGCNDGSLPHNNSGGGDIAVTLQTVVTIGPGETKTLRTELEYFGELAQSIQDGDADFDGVPDYTDNCPNVANPGQADADLDGVGDACPADADGDGVLDDVDNCPAIANPGQEDLDNDLLGDDCDDDDDGDGVLDVNDNCACEANADQGDLDQDGIGDVCDNSFQGGNLLDDVDVTASEASDLITASGVSGSAGLITKIQGNPNGNGSGSNSVAAIVAAAIGDYFAGYIDCATYVSWLQDGLTTLTTFDNQLAAKIGTKKNQLTAAEAAPIQALSAELRDLIQLLIDNAC